MTLWTCCQRGPEMLALLVRGESATGSWTSTVLFAKTELILLHGDFLLVEVILESPVIFFQILPLCTPPYCWLAHAESIIVISHMASVEWSRDNHQKRQLD